MVSADTEGLPRAKHVVIPLRALTHFVLTSPPRGDGDRHQSQLRWAGGWAVVYKGPTLGYTLSHGCLEMLNNFQQVPPPGPFHVSLGQAHSADGQITVNSLVRLRNV